MKRRVEQHIATGLRVRDSIDWRKGQQGRFTEALSKRKLASLLNLDETDRALSDEDFDGYQLLQASRQATALFHYYRLLNDRDTLALAGDSSQQVSGWEDWDKYEQVENTNCRKNHRTLRPRTFSLAVECAAEAGNLVIPSVSQWTVRAWHRDWTSHIDYTNEEDENFFGAFNPDDRGRTKRNWLMNENDLKEKFKLWMKSNLKNLSMASACKYVNEVLLKDESPELLSRYGLKLPISDKTVLAWMHKCGAETCWYKTSYYNDAHERPDVLSYRAEYIKKSEEIELRMHTWWQLEAADFEDNIKPTLDERLLQEALHATTDGSAPNLVPTPTPARVPEQPPRGGCRVKQISTGILGTVKMLCHLSNLYLKSWDMSTNYWLVCFDPELTASPETTLCLRSDLLIIGQPETLGRTPFPYTTPGGVQMVEVHLDLLNVDRVELENYGNLSVRMDPLRTPLSYCHIHKGRACLCHLPVIRVGHDESCFHGHDLSKRVWAVDGIMPPRSKGQGDTYHVSALQDDITGFGFPMTQEQLGAVNTKYGKKLSFSPGIVCLDPGKNKDGLWDYEQYAKQVVDFRDCARELFPGYQIVLEDDHSQNHAKQKEGGLNVNNMSAKFGGKQHLPRPIEGSRMEQKEGYLGDNPLEVVFPKGVEIPTAWRNEACTVDLTTNTITVPQMKLKVGDVQHFAFTADDLPPFDEPLSLPQDSESTKNGVTKLVPGYVGKQKGLRQVLMERGLHVRGMKVAELRAVLALCWDFKHEECALEDLVHILGDIVFFSPKAHPEVAGLGIEFSWGCAKLYFRSHNDCNARRLHGTVHDALKSISMKQVHKFGRRCRDYRHTYKLPGSEVHITIEALRETARVHRCTVDVEALKRKSKTHRSTLDQDRAFLLQAMEP